MTKIFFILFILNAFAFKLEAQVCDLELFKQHFQEKDVPKREPKFGISTSKSVLIKYNPINLMFGALMYSYQKFVSKQTNSNCPYSPSCSEFGKQLIQRYGLFKGIPCAADRLMRCSSPVVNQLDWKRDFIDKHIHERTDYYQFKP